MRKAVIDATRPPKEGSGRRYWVHSSPTGTKSSSLDSGGKRPPKARFLEPYRFSDAHRAALIGALETAGVGDGESRELFASAVEYDIANARQAIAKDAKEPVAEDRIRVKAQPEKSGSAQSPAQPSPVGELARTARELSRRLSDLDEATRASIAAALQAADPFQRGYDGAYFQALCGQLEQVAMAADSQPEPEPKAAVPEEASMSVHGRRFLRRVARVYLEVLESRPDPSMPAGPFITALRLVSDEAGIRLPNDLGALTRALEGP